MRTLCCVLLLSAPCFADWPQDFRYQGHTWTFYYHARVIEANVDDCQPAGCDGLTWCDERRIDLNGALDAWELRETVLHEVMHALSGCRNPTETRHQSIYLFSVRLLRVLADNPKLRHYLFP